MLRSWLRTHLRAPTTTGTHQRLGLILAIAAAALGVLSFLAIVAAWTGPPALSEIDATVREAVAGFTLAGIRPVVHATTLFGSTRWAAVLGLGIGVWLLKNFFQRARPVTNLLGEHGYSFPSGHSTIAVLLYGFLAAYGWAHLVGRSRAIVVVAAVSLVLLIGFSRLYFEVHYATDVLGGYVVGTTWLVVALALSRAIAAWLIRVEDEPHGTQRLKRSATHYGQEDGSSRPPGEVVALPTQIKE